MISCLLPITCWLLYPLDFIPIHPVYDVHPYSFFLFSRQFLLYNVYVTVGKGNIIDRKKIK